MNIGHLRSRVTDAFRPFAVVTSSGNKYPVPHPDFLFLTQRTVFVADACGYAMQIDPLNIVGLEDLPARKNGRAKRLRR